MGLIVLGAIILVDIVVMVLVMRMILTEPPHKHPSPHPLVLEMAGEVENGVESPPVQEADETDSV